MPAGPGLDSLQVQLCRYETCITIAIAQKISNLSHDLQIVDGDSMGVMAHLNRQTYVQSHIFLLSYDGVLSQGPNCAGSG